MTRKVNPNWEDRDYGYAKNDGWEWEWDYTRTPRGMQKSQEEIAWRLEFLTTELLEYSRLKQVCLCGYQVWECDEERGGEACRTCLEEASLSWDPLHFA